MNLKRAKKGMVITMTREERKKLVRDYLGKTVDVEIDRPIGYVHHKKDRTLHYPINYGFLPNVKGGDGEDLDVYVLGTDRPLKRCRADVIGIVYREDDVEDKLIATVDGKRCHQGELAAAIAFQEAFYRTRVEALYQKSCGVFLYRKAQEEFELLLVFQHASQTWSVPKGHMEAGETELQTAKRELLEETGLSAEPADGFRAALSYPISDPPHAQKEVVLFAAELPTDEPRLPSTPEVERFCWVNFAKARTLLIQGYQTALDSLEAWLQTHQTR